jgi:protocatechuate 3,4-dioxygenase beta subunit
MQTYPEDIEKRTYEEFIAYEKVRHDFTGKYHYNAHTPEKVIFGSNVSCILTPEDIGGPYYVAGEYIRSNVVERQAGIPMFLETQFVDIKTCKPATNLLIEIWAANATGVYSGISGIEGGLNSTFLRGAQKTDADGVTEFNTIFPGHYTGRVNHQHIISHSGAKILPNGSFTGGRVSHIGQLFFDQKLIDAIENLSPYNLNTQPKTLNDYDMWNAQAASADYDPFAEYIRLGPKLQDGLFVWKSIGVNVSADWSFILPPAAYLASDGGHDNPNFVFPPTGVPFEPNTITGPTATATST